MRGFGRGEKRRDTGSSSACPTMSQTATEDAANRVVEEELPRRTSDHGLGNRLGLCRGHHRIADPDNPRVRLQLHEYRLMVGLETVLKKPASLPSFADANIHRYAERDHFVAADANAGRLARRRPNRLAADAPVALTPSDRNNSRRFGLGILAPLGAAVLIHALIVEVYAESRLRRHFVTAILHGKRLDHQIVLDNMRNTDRILNPGEGCRLMSLEDLRNPCDDTVLNPERDAGDFSHQSLLDGGLADRTAHNKSPQQPLTNKRHRIGRDVLGELNRKTAFELTVVLDARAMARRLDREVLRKPGIHLTQVTPTSCSWAHSVLASQSATIERYGVGSTAMACCTRR